MAVGNVSFPVIRVDRISRNGSVERDNTGDIEDCRPLTGIGYHTLYPKLIKIVQMKNMAKQTHRSRPLQYPSNYQQILL